MTNIKPLDTPELVTIIAGSRSCTDYEELKYAVGCATWKIKKIISGGAKGVDKLGERFAKENNLPLEIYPADWKRYGKSAGYKRNLLMAEKADALIALWDGKSKGTNHMIDIANTKRLNILVRNVDIKPPVKEDLGNTDYHDFTKKDTPKQVRQKYNVGDIWNNGAKCLICEQTIRSKNRHDFNTCECGNLSVDGGSWYIKRSIGKGKISYQELSEPFADAATSNLRMPLPSSTRNFRLAEQKLDELAKLGFGIFDYGDGLIISKLHMMMKLLYEDLHDIDVNDIANKFQSDAKENERKE